MPAENSSNRVEILPKFLCKCINQIYKLLNSAIRISAQFGWTAAKKFILSPHESTLFPPGDAAFYRRSPQTKPNGEWNLLYFQGKRSGFIESKYIIINIRSEILFPSSSSRMRSIRTTPEEKGFHGTFAFDFFAKPVLSELRLNFLLLIWRLL